MTSIGKIKKPSGKKLHQAQQLFQQATQYHQTQQLDLAKPLYEKILTIQPNHADALHLLGLIYAGKGDAQKAIELISRAIRYFSTFPAYYVNRGLLYRQTGRIQEAAEDYRKAIQLAPKLFDTYSKLGDVLLDLEQYDQAIEAYQTSIQYNPNHIPSYNNLGNTYLAKQFYQQAIDQYKKVVMLQPNCAEAWSNMGVALAAMGKVDEAIESYQKATQWNSQYAKAYSNLGLAYNQIHRYDDAYQAYQKAIQLAPNDAEVYSNLGVNCKDQNQTEEALECFRKSLSIDPSSAKTQFNEAITLLVNGDYVQGWQKYESRFGLPERRVTDYHFTQPVWRGENLMGKTLFVWVEQGLGDTLQFVRFLPLLRQYGGKIIFECQSELFLLLKGNVDVDQFVLRRAPRDHFDYHIPLMSLPFLMNIELDNIPFSEGYIKPLTNHSLNHVIQRQKNKKQIGIIWQGSKQHKNDQNRSISLSLFKTLIDGHSNDQFYSLQYGDQQAAIRENQLSESLIDLSPHIKDFSDTAALINQLDLVITIDTSVAHLSAAMGKPTWVLLPFAPDFRWLLSREDSPWYQSVRLFRQSKPADWGSVFTLINLALT